MVSLNIIATYYLTIQNHPSPGRFFAANEVKAMMAHFILNYDFKLEQGVKPPDQWFGTSCLPNTQAPILFRRRQRAEV